MGTQLPFPKREHNRHQLSAHFYCGQTAGCIKMPLGMKVGFSPRDCVRWGSSSLPRQGAEPPNFRPVYCGQTAAWIKMPLGTEVGLGPGDIVRLGPIPCFPKRGHNPPIFGPCLLWLNGSMDEDVTWYGTRPRPKPHCVRREPSSPAKGRQQPPLFSAHAYCGHGRPSQLLLSSCQNSFTDRPSSNFLAER